MFARLVAAQTLLLTLLLIVGCGPFLVFPGGKLDGIAKPTPSDWSITNDVDTVQLESDPEAPYSVNIWVVAMDGGLYVHAGANHNTWVAAMEEDPAVRLRVNDAVYPLSASRVIEQAEFDRFSDAWENKYDRRPSNENAAEAYLFRLQAR